jgi:lipoyl(octanoyl) transferase
MALNVSLDPEPFQRIDVCGYPGLAVTRLADLCSVGDVRTAAEGLLPHLSRRLGIETVVERGTEWVTQSAISTSLQAVSSR